MRSYGAAVCLAPQVAEGMGGPEAGARIIGSVGTVICHQLPAPEELVRIAGTRLVVESSIQHDGGLATGMGSARMQHAVKVDPNEVRALAPGMCFVIGSGRAAKVAIARAPAVAQRPLPAIADVALASTAATHRPRHAADDPAAPMKRLSGLRLAGHALFATTLALELALAYVRFWVVAVPLGLVLWIGTYDDSQGETIAGWAGAGAALALPLAAPAAFIGLPGGGLLTRWQLGARAPSARERLVIGDALSQLPGSIRGPRWLFVIDDPTPSASVVGQALYVRRALVWDAALAAVLAHELGHLNSLDGRLTLALRRLAPVGSLGEDRATLAEGIAVLFLGGISVALLSPVLSAFWRRREFAADAYAARLGQGAQLAAHLERTQFFDVAVPFLSGRVHPHTEQGLERLARLEDEWPLAA